MILENNMEVCKEHTLTNTENILYWMNSDYIFYYSCENCTKCGECKKAMKQ